MLRKYQNKLRKNSTQHEKLIWSFLRNRKLDGNKFRRQVVIGNYIVDFVCYEKKLIVELDGGQHIEDQKYDEIRTKFLNDNGFQLLRFWNGSISGGVEKIMSIILGEIKNR